jgi:hypothetical protein
VEKYAEMLTEDTDGLSARKQKLNMVNFMQTLQLI